MLTCQVVYICWLSKSSSFDDEVSLNIELTSTIKNNIEGRKEERMDFNILYIL